MSLASINFIHLTVSEILPRQDFIVQGHYKARSQVKSRSHNDVAHLYPLNNVPTMYQLPKPFGFRDIARTGFYRSRSLLQGQIKVTPSCCTPTPPNQCPYQASTSYTLLCMKTIKTRTTSILTHAFISRHIN